MITTNENKGKFIFLSLLIFVFIGVFLVAKPAFAIDVLGMAASILGWAIMQVVSILGKILTWVIGLLIEIAQYNGFITSQAVSKGWIIIRDVCNMFFIAALLLIAFGTVLKVEKYSYKRTLGGLLVAAILINFSKFICGFFIDIAQILMLTFVNAFKEAGAGNFLQMLGMDKWLNLSGASAGGASVLTGAVFALILVIISLIVISIMMIILAFRIIMIWLLVVLSPLVFVLNVFPGKMKSYSNMWWEKFTSYLIVGPVMAFFLWLSFAIANESSITVRGSKYSEGGSGGTVVELTENSVSEAANPSNFAKFVVSIAMLVGSLLIAQQLGVAGGKLAGKAVGKMQGYATGKAGILKKVKRTGKLAVKGAAGAAGRLTGQLAGGLAQMPAKGIGKTVGWIDKKTGGGAGRFTSKLKKKGIESAKRGAERRQERLKSGKGNLLDKAWNNLKLGATAGSAQERSEAQGEQMKRVEDAKKRMVGKNKDQLTVISKTGTVAEKAAVGVMMAESGQLKVDSPQNRQIIKDTQQSMQWNKPLRDQFNGHIKKNSDADMVIATQYNNLESASDARQLSSDIKEGKVNAGKMVQEIETDKDFDNLKEKFTEIGEDFGKIVLQSLSGKELKDLRGSVGKERLNKVYGEYRPDGKNEAEQIKYIQATGRVDNLSKDKNEINSFVEDHKVLVKNNISPESLKDKNVVEAIIKHLSSKEREAITSVGDNKEVILNTLKESISDYNKEKKVDTTEAKDAREEYFKLNKGGSISGGYYAEAGDNEKEKINKDLTKKVSVGSITMKHVAKLTLDMKNGNDKDMAVAIAGGMNMQKLKELAKLNSTLKETIKGLCIDWAKSGTPEEKKQAKIVLGDTEYSEHLRTEKKEKSNKNPKE